jgi:NTE family protein
MTTAFVLSGGGSLGAVQVGMLRALTEHGVVADMLVGTSVGAINAAWLAGSGMGPDAIGQLREVWLGTRRQDVFPLRPITGLSGFAGRADHLVVPNGLRSLLRRNLSIERLEDATVPVTVVATEVTTGIEVALSSGDAVDAVTASAAIPGVFPPVRVGQRVLMDGGVANNTPISHAISLGADTIWVLPTGYACDLAKPPRSALGMLLQAATLLMQGRLMIDVEHYQDHVDLQIIPPLCPLDVSPVDFSRTSELVNRGYQASKEWLASGRSRKGQERFLRLQRH